MGTSSALEVREAAGVEHVVNKGSNAMPPKQVRQLDRHVLEKPKPRGRVDPLWRLLS